MYCTAASHAERYSISDSRCKTAHIFKQFGGDQDAKIHSLTALTMQLSENAVVAYIEGNRGVSYFNPLV